MKTSKKAVNLLMNWVEYCFLALLIAGFMFSLKLGSAFLAYTVGILFGFFAGRFVTLRKKSFPAYIIVAGLFVGFMLGVWLRGRGSVLVALWTFVLGAAFSYYLHETGKIE
jgi:hypothetical protein